MELNDLKTNTGAPRLLEELVVASSLRQYETKNLNIIMSRLQSFSTGTLLKFSCARLVVVY
jgi:hypothetical protein